MAIVDKEDLDETSIAIWDFLETRRWKLRIGPYLCDGFGELNVTTPDGLEENYDGDEEISTFFRAIDQFIK